MTSECLILSYILVVSSPNFHFVAKLLLETRWIVNDACYILEMHRNLIWNEGDPEALLNIKYSVNFKCVTSVGKSFFFYNPIEHFQHFLAIFTLQTTFFF